MGEILQIPKCSTVHYASFFLKVNFQMKFIFRVLKSKSIILNEMFREKKRLKKAYPQSTL